MQEQGEGFSYIRFSDPRQKRGDSRRRQTEAADNWCRNHNIRLNTTTFFDPGRSAFNGEHRKNPDRHALAAFLEKAEEGDIKPGSYLILESLDRLTREHVRAALMLCLGLIEKGIRIVQLSPVEMVFDEKCDEMALMFMIGQLARGHGESKRKSDMIGAWWRERITSVRERGEFIITHLPHWIKVKDGKPFIPSDCQRALTRLFELAAAGHGGHLLIKRLRAEKVPAFGKSGDWKHAYIVKLLRDRRVLGEYQPRTKNGKPDGAPIPNYFPAAIPESLWQAVQAGMDSRRVHRGRIGRHVNLFSGLIVSAIDGGTYSYAHRERATGAHSVITNTSALNEGVPALTFPADAFETAFLALLREIRPADLLGHDQADEQLEQLLMERRQVKEQRAKLEPELLGGDLREVVDTLRSLAAQEAKLDKAIAAAQQKAAMPLQTAWDETQGLLGMLASAADPDVLRLKLRARLRALIEKVVLLVVRRGIYRVAAWQVFFNGAKGVRTYVAVNRRFVSNGKGSYPGGTWFGSWLSDGVEHIPDLRDRDHAERFARFLQVLDVKAFCSPLPGRTPDVSPPSC